MNYFKIFNDLFLSLSSPPPPPIDKNKRIKPTINNIKS